MKYSEELQLRLKGVKSEEIAAMKEQEAKELLEAQEVQSKAEEKAESENLKLLEEAQQKIAELENALESKENEVKEINDKLISLSNKVTTFEEPAKVDGATEVLPELLTEASLSEALERGAQAKQQ